MKSYIFGRYDESESESEKLCKETNKKILRALRDSYPKGLDNPKLLKSTGLPRNTVYQQVKELKRECFIYEISPESHHRGKT